MGKIIEEYESEYDVGDIVIFNKNDMLLVGIIEGYYIDHKCDDSFWYNIRINQRCVYSYSNGGDVLECDIVKKLDEALRSKVRDKIMSL